jgi:methylase of polypeptide subunit release factors
MTVRSNLQTLADRWSDVTAAERANYQLYLSELAEALEVPKPQPAGSGYQFELPVRMVNPDGSTTTRFADLVKDGFFLLEAKDAESGRSTDLLLRRAFGQATQYAGFLAGGHPPYLLVLDVGSTLIIWDRWGGTYGGFQAGRKIDLRTLHGRPEDIALLQDIWIRPEARDPRARANAVTREIADKLAHLAASLEDRGHDSERVARFLMRCVFTMFAEDVDLVPDKPFQGAVALGLDDPDDFASAATDLWAAMDAGTRFGLKRLLRFNGHFFKDQEVLPLTKKDLSVLYEAAKADWQNVEPTIFGTLLVRALDPVERHRLGAEYTPREYVQRLVLPTIEVPVREKWGLLQAEVLQLREKGRPVDMKRALERLRDFHGYLRGLRVLDPACGSGNFLYVALATLKAIELEVLREIEGITGAPELAVDEVGPWQFYGIEVKPWARELAELTLWVGYYQWWRQTHGHTLPPEPVLRDTGTLECRDAVLAWDEIVHVPEKDRPDPTSRIVDPVTGKLVPDPAAKLPYMEYRGARQAEWPEADFIVGNPPYLGSRRVRDSLGDGYAEALRAAYRGDVPDGVDFVMYWWFRAAREVAHGRTLRAGLITTNSITQSQSRKLVERAAGDGASVCWTAPDHPWVDEADGAAVRVAMTVVARGSTGAYRIEVDEFASVTAEIHAERLNWDLSAHADVAGAAAVPLRANAGLSSQGFILVGSGFVLEPGEANALLEADARNGDVIRRYITGSDLTKRDSGQFVIDFGLRTEPEARQYAVLFDLVRSRVKPKRDSTNREGMRVRWWLFGEPRSTFRPALSEIPRCIVTSEVAKHRFFTFAEPCTIATNTTVMIASANAHHFGVLSSRVHVAWALAAGGRMGVGNDPRYQKAACFDSFPFPAATDEQCVSIGEIAERLDRHRVEALRRDSKLTMTGIYNVVDKLRSGETLTAKEREIHTIAACGVLKDLHDELDRAVTEAYGWPDDLTNEEILARLVALHDERVREEQRGLVRWLRPDYQKSRFGQDLPETAAGLDISPATPVTVAPVPSPWSEGAPQQLAALQAAISGAPSTLSTLRERFPAAKRSELMQHLEALTVLGLIREADDGVYVGAKVLVPSAA